MNEDVTTLGIGVEYGDVGKASKELDNLTKSGKNAEGMASGLKSSFGAVAATVTAVSAAVSAASLLLINNARTFQVLEASLKTVTGSAENAAIAMEAIKDFAATTPYSVEQSTEAFIKLKALGLDPSERALRSYGNTASAMGKDLTQMIEAVADASTGEFERLKEFGIKANKEGDDIRLRFQGVTTTIKNNSEEIQSYLMKIGEVNFAGAMEERAKTIDGALSNLGDTWDSLLDSINKAGAADLFSSGISALSEGLTEITDQIKSGQLQSYMGAVGVQFEGIAGDISASFDIMAIEIAEAFGKTGIDGASAAEAIANSFINLPTTIREGIQTAVVETASFFDVLKAKREEFDRTGKTQDITNQAGAGASSELVSDLERINQIREDSLNTIKEEAEASRSASEKMIEDAKKLREEYEAEQEARKKLTADRLAQFKNETGSEQDTGYNEKEAAASQKRFEQLVAQLSTEEELIYESYEKRRQIIEEETAQGSEIQADLHSRNYQRLEEDLAEFNESKIESIRQSLLSEEEAINESYENRREMILEHERKTGEDVTKLLADLKKDRDERLADVRSKEQDGNASYQSSAYNQHMNFLKKMEVAEKSSGLSRVNIATDAFAQITAAGAQNSRKMFELNKIAGIANATISTAQGATKALEWGYPMGPIFAALIVAAGAAQIAAINSTSFEGGGGGTTPSMAGGGGTVNGFPVDSSTPTEIANTREQVGATIIINGDINSNNAETLLRDLKELINDQDFVLIENTSRQASELRT